MLYVSNGYKIVNKLFNYNHFLNFFVGSTMLNAAKVMSEVIRLVFKLL